MTNQEGKIEEEATPEETQKEESPQDEIVVVEGETEGQFVGGSDEKDQGIKLEVIEKVTDTQNQTEEGEKSKGKDGGYETKSDSQEAKVFKDQSNDIEINRDDQTIESQTLYQTIEASGNSSQKLQLSAFETNKKLASINQVTTSSLVIKGN